MVSPDIVDARADAGGATQDRSPRPWRFAPAAGGAALLVAYLATLAPGLTFWDAGEFIAAVHTFGIPHPPGTPLYIVIARAWALLLPAMDTARAVNLLSAVATAAACAVGGLLIAAALRGRAPGDRESGTDGPSGPARPDGPAMTGMVLAAVIASGAMSTVWLNATEAEVYAPSLLLSALMLLSAERARRSAGIGWLVLTGYLFALCSPLHVGALVAAPAAIILAASRADGSLAWDRVVASGAAAVAAAALSLGSGVLAMIAGLALLALPFVREGERGARIRLAAAMALVIGVALSAQLILLARAAHDPAVNQGNPATIGALLAVITREQYAVASLWPRQAPLWMQFANFLEYVDWQVALGLAPGVAPSPWRTPFTLLFIALGVRGARAHREHDRLTWRAMAVLLASATVGVILQLNLKAGPSIGYGILPDEAPHEPRERDYFFALAFWMWGLWAGVGTVAAALDLARRVRLRRAVAVGAAVGLAALPLALNWPAVDRGAMPDATLPRAFALGILESAPRNAVLFTWGDNDTYPLWYAREVEGIRRDLTLVTVPLLPAPWYRDEVARRTGLLDDRARTAWAGQDATLRRIAGAARAKGVPIATAITMPAEDRAALGRSWVLRGLVFVADDGAPSAFAGIDSAAARAAVERFAAFATAGLPRASTDPTARYIRSMADCPRAALSARGAEEAVISLAPVCNLR